MANMNGSGNHHDDGENDPKIARFPTPAERAEIERMKKGMEEARRKADQPASEPILNIPPATKYLSGLLIVIHVIMEFLPLELKEKALQFGAFLPQIYFTDMPLADADKASAVIGPFAHMLLHGGWLHLAMNVFTLMAFGAGLEKEIGRKKFLLIFVLTGLAGAFTHLAYIAWFHPNDLSPLVGASGGISGLFGGVLMMAHGRGLMGNGYSKLLPFIGIWILISLFFGIFGMPGTGAAIAWTTHIGGFIAGLLLYRPIAKMNI
ncbi:MAG: Rhomboid family protein [Alphaproteobacteria bacterium]|jgi:membrane associated rhomboid family serine protease|nr:Rhomboid family protein [Alphaproteobacteria bacterium]